MGLNLIDIYLWFCNQMKPVKIGFSYASRSDFTNPKFKWVPKIILVVFRSLFALYTVAFAVASGLESKHGFFEQMPLFAQAIGAVYFFVSAICTEVSFFRKIPKFSTHRETFFTNSKRRLNKSPTLETISDAEQQMPFSTQEDIPGRWVETSCQPVYKESTQIRHSKSMNLFWYHKLQWFLYDIAVSLNFTFTFSALIFMHEIVFSKAKGQILRINTYYVTSILLFIDFLLNSTPIRIIHILYPFALNSIYFIIVVINTKIFHKNTKVIAELPCLGSQCIERTAIILGIGSFSVHIMLCIIKCILDALARYPRKKSMPDSSRSQKPTSRKISRSSRNSDSTQMTSLDSCRTYASRGT